MYTRDFQTQDGEALRIPEGYQGNAFTEDDDTPIHTEEVREEEEKSAPAGLFGGLKSFLPSGLFGSSFPFFGGKEFKLGTEELLIIAVAAFLFFSKDGDRECALILIALLFIS